MSSNDTLGVQPHYIRLPWERYDCPQEVGTETMTQQHFLEECDINSIMAKYKSTGIFTHVQAAAAQFGDFSAVPSYQDGLNYIMEAQDLFDSLPARVRERFGNDPGQFIKFATDGKNIKELRELGLAPEEAEAPKPQLVQVVEPPEVPQGASKKSSSTSGGDGKKVPE